MPKIGFFALLAALLMSATALGQTEIHKCTDADGGVVFSQLPCKDEVPAEIESQPEPEAEEGPVRQTEAPVSPPPENSEEKPGTSASNAACKKQYRDEIDAIDAEIRREYSKEKDGEYKQRLLALTRKLRAC